MGDHFSSQCANQEPKAFYPLDFHREIFSSHHVLKLSTIFAIVSLFVYLLYITRNYGGTTAANKLHPLEPALFARIRWSLWAQQILEAADKKAHGRPYRLARGDKELVVLPARLIPELNRLGTDVLDSRQSHAFTLLGHLTGMEVVEKTSYHVRMLLARISPALPELFAPTSVRISTAMKQNFPQSHEWTIMQPLPATVRCFSEGIALALFGPKMTEDPRLVKLTYELTENVFKVAFTMRCVPSFLQPFLVWFLPAKWRLHRQWNELGELVIPEVIRQKDASRTNEATATVGHDLISWMVKDGRTLLERDLMVLTTLCGSVAAGSTYSIANFVCRALSDLTAHPDVLHAVRAEIREKHRRINGRWDVAALTGLDRLESSMKETARIAPGTLLVYSRVVQRDCVLGEVELKAGQFVTMSGPAHALDPAVFDGPKDFRGLRFCQKDRLEYHRSRPFRSVDTDILAWGAGRWACPGRLVVDMAAKILLIKLLDEYDFAFVDGKQTKPNAIHEFLFFHIDNKMLVRRRKDTIGIQFVDNTTAS